jgi:hypothetical protein
MEIPLLGMIIVPIALFFLLLPVRWMLYLSFFLAPFKASSVVSFTLGGDPTGIQAGNFGTVMLLSKLLLDALVRGRLTVSIPVARSFVPLAVFVVVASASAIVNTIVFSGTVEVFPASGGMRPDDIRVLRLGSANFTQTVYLIFDVAYAWAIANTVVTGGLYLRSSKTYILTTAFIIVMGSYQLFSHYLGFYYPYDFINNNPGYKDNFLQEMANVKRFSSVFTEPSAAAHWLVGFLPFAFTAWLKGLHGRGVMLLGVAALACIIVATSTTGYAVLAMFGALLGLNAVRKTIVASRVRKRIFELTLSVLTLIAFGLGAFWFLGLFELVLAVSDQAVVNKLVSSSADMRFAVDYQALVATWQTFGLGVGWGSHRASSQLLTLLSNVGIPGMIILGWFTARLYSSHRRLSPEGGGTYLAGLVSATGWALVGMLLAAVVAAGDPNSLGFWLVLGLYIGALAGREAEVAAGGGGQFAIAPTSRGEAAGEAGSSRAGARTAWAQPAASAAGKLQPPSSHV